MAGVSGGSLVAARERYDSQNFLKVFRPNLERKE
jgi:hypothetical protein